MKQFKNLSQFKKLLVVGQKINTIFHKKIVGRENGKPVFESFVQPTREISVVQSNSFAIKTEKTDGTFQNSWCAYPKASESKVVIDEENEICELEIYEEDGSLVLTYWLEN